MPPHEVLNILKTNSGSHFDPVVVDAFLTAYRLGEWKSLQCRCDRES